jgi:L-alanine-DL-glutamate epimerase-like enolase superfamily enzyme
MSTKPTRREFFKRTALGGAAAGGVFLASPKHLAAGAAPGMKRLSSPSRLEITDLRYVLVEHLGRRIPILRIDTNQDIYGLGEVRDGGDERYALMLKSRLLGKNPCNVEPLFKALKPFGGHGRLGGGVSGVEMALWDLTGKAYGVPVWQLLGGKYRDRVRLYVDTHGDTDMDLIKAKLEKRIEDQGFTWLKMTRCFNVVRGIPDGYIHARGRELTEAGIERIVEYLRMVRDFVGHQMPVSADHFGDRNPTTMIRLGKALDPLRLAWMEEPVYWQNTTQLKEVKDAIDTPVLTGENIFGLEAFQALCDAKAVDMVHPDLATAGGILETKKIGDYAEAKGITMAMHYAGTPVSFMANVHCAAATENAVVLEFHPEDEQIPEWENMVRTTGELPLITRGYANVPDTPGLGVELNETAIRKVLHPSDRSFFAPTEAWNERNSLDNF